MSTVRQGLGTRVFIGALEPEILYYYNYGSGARLCYGPIEVGSVGPLLRKRFSTVFVGPLHCLQQSRVCTSTVKGIGIGLKLILECGP